MASRVDSPLRGIGVLSPSLVFENLAPNTGGTTESSYTESTPRPGRATTSSSGTRVEPVISGGQAVGVDVQVRRGGMPERRGLELLWRKSSETSDSDWRGHNPPSLSERWISAVWDTSNAHEVFDLVVTNDDQQLVLVYLEDSTTSSQVWSRAFDFDGSTPAWGAQQTVSVDPYEASASPVDVSSSWLCACALPDNRIVCFARPTSSAQGVFLAWASDDRGATWFQYAVPGGVGSAVALGFGTSNVRARVVQDRGDVAMFLNTAAGAVAQVVSYDLGLNFEAVGTTSTGVGTDVSAGVIPGGGGIVVGYLEGSSYPAIRVLSSAGSPFDDATEVVVDSVACDRAEVSVDGVGNIWVFCATTANPEQVRVYVSDDGGQSFAQCQNLHDTGDASTYLQHWRSIWVRGWHVLGTCWTTDTTTAPIGSIGTLWSAGWCNATSRGIDAGSIHEDRKGWADAGAASDNYLPIELPTNYAGWTATGTAPTLTDGELRFTTGAVGTAYLALSADDPVTARGSVRIVSGSGSSTTPQVYARVIDTNNVTTYSVSARFDAANSRIRVVDPYGSLSEDIDGVDLSRVVEWLMWVNQSFNYGFWWRYRGETKWNRAVDYGVGDPLLTDGGATGITASRVEFGQSTTAAVVSAWGDVVARPSSMGGTGAATGWLGVGFSATEYFQVHDRGGQVTWIPRPIPDIGSEAATAFLSARRGPAVVAETFEILPQYEYGVDRLFPPQSASLLEPWRSSDLTEQRIVFDLGAAQNIGLMWQYAFGLFNANIRTAYIERYYGGAWVTVATYDAATGFSGLGYARNGDYIRPTTGSATAGRYLARNELAGGFAILSSGVARRILGNSPGLWAPDTAGVTIWPEIRLDGITGAEPSSGTCTLVWPGGVAVSTAAGSLIGGRQPGAGSMGQYWQLRIPVQDVVDDYYQVGAFVPTTVAGFGKQWSRGFTKSRDPQTSLRVSRKGTRRKKKLGEPVDQWVLGWADAVFERFLTVAQPNFLGHADVGSTLYPALAGQHDVWSLLLGLLDETGGGEASVLALDEVPLGPTTITDRRSYLYGTWDSGVQANQVEEHLYRIDPITIVAQR